MIFARIAVNTPSDSSIFDYSVPELLVAGIHAGCLVTVPFGKQVVQGVILELLAQPSVAETKPIFDLLDPLPVLTSVQIALAKWLASETLSPLAACINLMLPSGLSQRADVLYSLSAGGIKKSEGQSSVLQHRLLDLLREKGSLRSRQIDRHFRNVDWRRTARALLKSGEVTSQSILPAPSLRPKFIRSAQLSVPLEVAATAMPGLGKTTQTLTRRQSALQFLMREPSDINVSWVYAESGCNLADLQELAERELIVLRETEIWRDPLAAGDAAFEEPGMESKEEVPVLTTDQHAAWDEILNGFQLVDSHPSSFLLHGVTGSGKTELYLRATQECLRRQKQVIMLVPEIALTPQTVHRFQARFPGQVGLLHSKLSDGENYDTWRRARKGLLNIIIGPRSALFAPLPNVGLIIADECHDPSYVQSEPPFYSAVSAAKAYARLSGAVCILGSATPSIVQRFHASPDRRSKNGEQIRLLELPNRILSGGQPVEYSSLPPVSIVDMRAELKSSNRGIFSQELVNSLEQVLSRDQQAILFLNRRGTATYVFCRECGNAVRCPRCDTPLTYHLSPSTGSSLEPDHENHDPGDALLCHRCGYRRRLPEKCAACGSTQIRQYGLGSEKVEAELGVLFPSARILRWDWDTTRRKGAHEIILNHFSAHRADVLVGTQMLAKGLDLPLVTLVGIVLADLGLNLPDPFAPERTFSVLTQVSGRAGRSTQPGRVILQTFQPEHYVIQAAARHDYAGFYACELEHRREMGYPPFSRLVRLEYRHVQAGKAETEARQLAELLATYIKNQDRRETTLIGPVPCYYSRLNSQYRWQVILRGPDPTSLLPSRNVEGSRAGSDRHPLGGVLKGWRVEVDPISLL
jgi:primosomal protein N' (replication factor Y)